ncbi:MAG: regulatory iron-sulfur-containing complex subunit RicT [Hydrogenobacter sp.]|uniref:PSP1 domain-containing protein n=1 Tax=Hydrogenobacter thermophilus TaxID=940 RepID=UPI0030F5C725
MSYVKARFHDTGKILQVDGVWDDDINRNDLIVVSSEKGEEIVKVLGVSKEPSQMKATFLRKAKDEDIKKMEENMEKAESFYTLCKEKIVQHGLDMKLIKVYIPLDANKVFFYYTSDQRVDFRNLVKDLAKVIKKRIEMRQIGVRDAVQMTGWIGACGEVPCCVKFSENFESISLKDIEEQNLPLSPTKFTGPCGRLMCCLAYERDNYIVKNLFPEVGTQLCFKGRTYKLLYVDPPSSKVLLEADGKKEELNMELLLPYGYEKALKHCKSCGFCCRRAYKEDEAFINTQE